MMNRRLEMDLMRLLHGELPEPRARELRERMLREPELAAAYRRIEAVWRGLDLPPAAPPPPGFAGRVMARAREAQAGKISWALAPTWVRTTAAAALAAGLVVGVGLGTLPGGGGAVAGGGPGGGAAVAASGARGAETGTAGTGAGRSTSGPLGTAAAPSTGAGSSVSATERSAGSSSAPATGTSVVEPGPSGAGTRPSAATPGPTSPGTGSSEVTEESATIEAGLGLDEGLETSLAASYWDDVAGLEEAVEDEGAQPTEPGAGEALP